MSGADATSAGASFDERYAAILAVYRELGCPETFISLQATPLRDARRLAEIVAREKPATIVEIGTFIGVSTMVMAAAASPTTRLWSVDPNPRLDDSWRSALSGKGVSLAGDLPTVHEVARRAAEKLGVADRMEFVQGGFAVGETYSVDGGSGVRAVGEELLARTGPIDLFFIDGLHYEFAALADIELAARHLSPRGVLVLHDTVGMWGTSIRSAVRTFMAANPGWIFEHPPLERLYDSVATLRRAAGAPADGAAQHPRTPSWLEDPAIATRAALESLRQLAPRRIGSLGAVPAPLRLAFAEHGIAPEALDLNADGETEVDLLLCSAPESLGADPAALARWCADHAAAVLLASGPPGEMSAALPAALPRHAWVEAFRAAGFEPDDSIARAIDPLTYTAGAKGVTTLRSTRDLSIVLLRRDRSRAQSERGSQDRIEDLLAQVAQLNPLLEVFREERDHLLRAQAQYLAEITEQRREIELWRAPFQGEGFWVRMRIRVFERFFGTRGYVPPDQR